jgi:cell division transport system permease protein
VRALRYAIDEAALSLWRGRQSAVLSTATIALALFVLGAFLIATTNLERLGDEWSSAAGMSVYLTDGASEADKAAIEQALAAAGIVSAREFVSREEAVRRFKRTFEDLASAVEGLGENPLPASYEVRLGPGAEASIDTLIENLQGLAGVADVRYDRQWLTRLMGAVRVVRGIGLALGAILTFASALTVANVVRLGLFARRDELDIMQLVGAPQAYIRGPFVMEGTLQGGIGAIVALLALALVFYSVRSPILVPLASSLNLSAVGFLSAGVCVLLVLGGMAVGCLGGFVAAWGRV